MHAPHATVRNLAWRPALGLLLYVLGLAAVLGSGAMPLWVLKLVASARFVGGWLDVPSALLLVLCTAVLVFVPVGLLSARIVSWLPHLRTQAMRRSLGRRCVALLAHGVLAGSIAMLACTVAWLIPALLAPSPPWLMVALPALIGSLGGVVMQRSWKGLAVFVATILAVCVTLWGALLDGTPMTLPGTSVATTGLPVSAQSVDVKAVIERLKAGNPLRMSTAQRAAVAVTPDELTALLRWLAQRVDPGATVRVAGDRGRHAVDWTVALALPMPVRRHLNVSGTSAVRLIGTTPVMPVCELAIGSVHMSAWLCEQMLLGWYPSGGAAPDALAAPVDLLHAVVHVEQLRVDEYGAGIAYRRVAMDDASRRVFQQLLGPGKAVTAAVAAQLLYVQQDARRLRTAPDRFQAVLQNAFRLAQVRSRVGDPVAENQGAILALGMLFGSEDVAIAAGMPRPQNIAEIAAQIGPLTLLGREDWVKHFLVSAALVQVATSDVSDVAGRVKEQLDARGGSGFSFADLLADRAGTRFGELLSADADAAAMVQRRLVSHYELTDFFPASAYSENNVLPEGMQQAQFQNDIGGVGGARYRVLEAEIARRLAECDFYR